MSAALPLLVLGAGGHGRVVIDVLRRGGAIILGVLDQDAKLRGARLGDVTVLGGDDVLATHSPQSVLLVNGLGNTARTGDSGLGPRRALFMAFKSQGYGFARVLSPDAVISDQASLEEGCQIITRAVIHPGAVIGANVIINTGAQIDHDCHIGAHSHIAPGAVLCGRVNVGEAAHIGAGAVVIEGITIGAGAVIAAGAVVVRDVAAGATVKAPQN